MECEINENENEVIVYFTLHSGCCGPLIHRQGTSPVYPPYVHCYISLAV